jgi:nicotinamide mononucleotide transporter
MPTQLVTLAEIYRQFIEGIQQTSWLEYIAVFTGIASVWFSKIENIWVYPIGIINTVIYIFLSIEGHLYGEASVNLYYTIMSVYGWVLWTRKDEQRDNRLSVSFSSREEWLWQGVFFCIFYVALYAALSFLKANFASGAIPWADALASGTAYTGMWLMARKKVESWYWWIATDVASIPLYFVKGYVFTSFYYTVLLVLAILGLRSWIRKSNIILEYPKRQP